MSKSKAGMIKWHRSQERECAMLATKYAKTKEYRKAASLYLSAAVHRAMHDALKQMGECDG